MLTLRAAGRAILPAALAVLVGCQASPPATQSGTPAPTLPAAGSVPCRDTEAPILIGPDGQQIVLSPAATTSAWISETGVTYYLRQSGECVWISAYVPAEETGGIDPFLSVFHGRLGSDLRIVGEFADLTGVLVPGWESGFLTYRITVEDDAVALVEERTSATEPPGCASGDGPCPPPRRLERISD